jgi:uncharacterized protein
MKRALPLWLLIPLLWATLLIAPPGIADVTVPPLQQRVTDLTGTLNPMQRADLDRRLAEFEQRKGSQIAVLILPTTQPETIEQFGIRVVDRWQLGRKGVDDGALILLAKDDRTTRIEVGRGLEGVVPDAVAKRIVEEIMIPHFRQGDFYGGIAAGVERTIALVDGEPLPEPAWRGHETRQINGEGVFFTFFGSIVLGHFLRIFLGRLLAGLIAGGVVGLAFSAFGLPLGLALIVALIVFVFVIGDSGRGGGGYYYGGGYGGGYRGSTYGGGFGDGFGGGGYGGDSGGFSGGGGGFSGGGASGRW